MNILKEDKTLFETYLKQKKEFVKDLLKGWKSFKSNITVQKNNTSKKYQITQKADCTFIYLDNVKIKFNSETFKEQLVDIFDFKYELMRNSKVNYLNYMNLSYIEKLNCLKYPLKRQLFIIYIFCNYYLNISYGDTNTIAKINYQLENSLYGSRNVVNILLKNFKFVYDHEEFKKSKRIGILIQKLNLNIYEEIHLNYLNDLAIFKKANSNDVFVINEASLKTSKLTNEQIETISFLVNNNLDVNTINENTKYLIDQKSKDFYILDVKKILIKRYGKLLKTSLECGTINRRTFVVKNEIEKKIYVFLNGKEYSFNDDVNIVLNHNIKSGKNILFLKKNNDVSFIEFNSEINFEYLSSLKIYEMICLESYSRDECFCVIHNKRLYFIGNDSPLINLWDYKVMYKNIKNNFKKLLLEDKKYFLNKNL